MSNLNLFTAASLQTMGGASLAIFLIVQLIKNLPGVRTVPTRWLAVIVGEEVFIAVTSPWPTTLGGWTVLVLNGVLAASAAIGGWHLFETMISSATQSDDSKKS